MSQNIWMPSKHGKLFETPKPPKNDTALSRAARSPYPAWATSAALLSAIPSCARNRAGYPLFVTLPLFSMIFGGTGYMLHLGDATNGVGTTFAWSGTFLFFNARNALRSKRPGPIALTTVVAGQAALYGYEYFFNST